MDGLWWTSHQHWRKQVNSTLIEFHLSETNDILIEFHLSETNGSCRGRTWKDHLTDRDAIHYAISPSLYDEREMYLYHRAMIWNVFVTRDIKSYPGWESWSSCSNTNLIIRTVWYRNNVAPISHLTKQEQKKLKWTWLAGTLVSYICIVRNKREVSCL